MQKRLTSKLGHPPVFPLPQALVRLASSQVGRSSIPGSSPTGPSSPLLRLGTMGKAGGGSYFTALGTGQQQQQDGRPASLPVTRVPSATQPAAVAAGGTSTRQLQQQQQQQAGVLSIGVPGGQARDEGPLVAPKAATVRFDMAPGAAGAGGGARRQAGAGAGVLEIEEGPPRPTLAPIRRSVTDGALHTRVHSPYRCAWATGSPAFWHHGATHRNACLAACGSCYGPVCVPQASPY